MNQRYAYLKKYIGYNDLKGTYFLPVPENQISLAEEKIGMKFPDQLRSFYREIGTGILSCGEKYPEMLADSVDNCILPPNIAVDYMLGVLQHPEGDYYMSESAYELLQPGDLPFFEISDSSSFMIMKLNSDNPNAVWFMGHEKIEDSFEKFIWNLYYDHPSYYSRGW
jgi:hypothetical protein